MRSEQEIRHELAKIESRLAWLSTEAARVEGQLAALVAELLDLEGAHDRHQVAVR